MRDDVLIAARAFGCPVRLAIYRALGTEGRTPTELAAMFEVPRPTISFHLLALLEDGLVEVRRRGRARIYRCPARRWFLAREEPRPT
jgi:DNA-binding transcriptional ArsR family regulator